jgi:hypothetical protein
MMAYRPIQQKISKDNFLLFCTVLYRVCHEATANGTTSSVIPSSQCSSLFFFCRLPSTSPCGHSAVYIAVNILQSHTHSTHSRNHRVDTAGLWLSLTLSLTLAVWQPPTQSIYCPEDSDSLCSTSVEPRDGLSFSSPPPSPSSSIYHAPPPQSTCYFLLPLSSTVYPGLVSPLYLLSLPPSFPTLCFFPLFPCFRSPHQVFHSTP